MLTKEQLLAKGKEAARRFTLVDLPTGGTVRVQSLTRLEQREWKKSWRKRNGELDRTKFDFSDDVLLAKSIVDDAGNQVFTPTDAFDGCFDGWDSGDINALLKAVSKLSNLEESADEGVDDAVKNLDATAGNDSSGGKSQDTD